MTQRILRSLLAAALAAAAAWVAPARAADWSTTELQFQYGKLDNAFAPGSQNTPILTLQHASGWKYGDNFFFVYLIDQTYDANYDPYA